MSQAATIYKSPEGRSEILSLYDRAEARVGVPFEHREVETSFGRTHVLIAGPEDGQPLVVFQGGNVVNPSTLGWFRPLLQTFRVYAPDTVGHPGRSAETRIDPRGDDLARWAVDVFDALGLDSPAVLGHSYGGGIILVTAACAPERISKAVVMMPAGVAMGSRYRMITRVLVPTFSYMLRPSEKPLLKLIEAMSSGEVDEQMMETVGLVFRYVRLARGFPRSVGAEELARFTAPTMLFAGENDVFFPADRVLPVLESRIPNLVASESIAGCGHFPTVAQLEDLNQKIHAFLLDDAPQRTRKPA